MTTSSPKVVDAIRETVRAHYAAAITTAVANPSPGCCEAAEPGAGSSTPTDQGACAEEPFGVAQYGQTDRDAVPPSVVRTSFGCGNPVLVADLHPGERVLDLGSGAGLDVLLSARRVGPSGRAYGLDMTDEMLAVARGNAAAAGATNVEFLKGHIERIPLPEASVDVVISNCVINLSADKPAVFAETFRVLAPGGRFGVADIVCDDEVAPEQRAEAGAWAECAAGALSRGEYTDLLRAAGFVDVEVRFTHDFEHGMHAAIVRAVKAGTA